MFESRMVIWKFFALELLWDTVDFIILVLQRQSVDRRAEIEESRKKVDHEKTTVKDY